MSDHADAEIIVEALSQMLGKQGETLRLSRATVTAVSGGLLSLQQGGMTGALDAGYPRVLPKAPAVGDEVIYVDLGGAPVVVGVLGGTTAPALLDLGAPLVGQTYSNGVSASAATSATNTSNSVYATVRAFTWSSIPDGTYDLMVDWSAEFSDSASGSINLQLIAGATNDTVFTLAMTTARETIRYVRTFSSVVIAGGITFTVQYKRDSGSGTASARNPAIAIHATRVS